MGQRPWGTSAREAAILKALFLSSPVLPWEHTHILCPCPLPPSPDMISLLLTPGGPRKETIVSSHTRELGDPQAPSPR